MAFAIEAVLNLVMGIAPLAAEAGLTVELSRLSTMSGAQQAALIARAVGEKGGVYVAERSGLTLAEIAGKVEPGSALAAKLEQEFLDIIAKRPTELSPAERGAIRDALATAASDANTAANGPDPAEDGDVDLKICQVPFITIELPKSGASVQPSVQRVNPYTLPKEFEEFSAQQLTAGIAPLPRMDLVIRGLYTGSDNGIDLIGLAIDEPGERFTLYHWECKFVLPGGSPKLGKRSDGTWI